VTNSRTKGRAGEQEVARILRDELRLEVRRNWEAQAAVANQCDLIGVPGWAVEVKRAKVLRIKEWWQQTVQQALAAKARPVLVYRQDRAPWSAMLSMMDLRPDLGHHSQCTMPLETWCALVRRQLDDAPES
tara:strand:- start:1653 stop:2045 length:393 start_codon:yes stop_codon:yes gene_type:complete